MDVIHDGDHQIPIPIIIDNRNNNDAARYIGSRNHSYPGPSRNNSINSYNFVISKCEWI